MGTLRATCDDCGSVQVFPDQICLLVCNLPAQSHYWFPCPQCGQMVVKQASDTAIAILLTGGVRPTMWRARAETVEPKPAAPLTYDDLLDFALQLGDVDTLAAEALDERQQS